MERQKQINAAAGTFKGRPAEHLARAKRVNDMGERRLALIAIRYSLESLLYVMAGHNGIYFEETEDPDLFSMIETLFSRGIIDKEQQSLMHKIRMSTNAASHVDISIKDERFNSSLTIKDMNDLAGIIRTSPRGWMYHELFEQKIAN